MSTAYEWDGLLEDCADHICRNLVSKHSGNQFAFALFNQSIDRSHRLVDEKLARRVVYATGCSEEEAVFFEQLKERVEYIDQTFEVAISHGTDCRHQHTDACLCRERSPQCTSGTRYASGSCDHACDYNCTYPVVTVNRMLFDQTDDPEDVNQDDPVLVWDEQDRKDDREYDQEDDHEDDQEDDWENDPCDRDDGRDDEEDADPEWASMSECDRRLMREEEEEYALVAARKALALG